ncbi:MAG: substrate-binding domain-containing protein [Rhodoglobus sp.]
MRGISSMATRALLADLSAAASAAGMPHLEIESVGGVDAARRVASRERFDLVFLASGALAELAHGGHVVASSLTPLALSPTAVAVPSRSAPTMSTPSEPAFPNAAGVRAALRQAGSIGYSTGPSGSALLRQIDRWGMTDELHDRLVQARPGMPVTRLLAAGEVEIGFQQLSEMVGQTGTRVLGVLPPDCGIDTVFAGGVATVAIDPAISLELLTFFASSDAATQIRKLHNFSEVVSG